MLAKSAVPIRVLILEDCPVVREGLGQWLLRHADCEVCAMVGAIDEAWAAVGRIRPDVLLMDLVRNGGDVVAFIRTLTAEHPAVKPLVFSLHDEGLFAERLLRAGAAGYVSKNVLEAELVAAVRTVATGGIYVSPRLSLMLLGRLLRPAQKASDKSGVASLTDRELHVFQLLGAGLGAREIAARLGVSTKTVQAHRENIKNKLGFDTAAELLRHAALWLHQQDNGHDAAAQALGGPPTSE
jgi:DNA-binding NarL/FixJ family response regulator